MLLKGPLAGPLFENFCIQETVKIYLHRGEQPPLFYLRTAAGLEVDLLIERSFGKVVPVKIKLNKTPSASLASSLMKFTKAFSQLITEEPMRVSLADHTVPLTREMTAVSLDDYLMRLRAGSAVE
jgi:predicted AAA+ superfamily ATPase